MSLSQTTPESKLKSESQGSLPEYFSLWVGDPSELDKSDQKIPRQDTLAALGLLRNLKNPFRFVCLEKHVAYYDKFFKEKGFTVEIQSAESFLKKCEEDEFLKPHAEKIRHIFSTYLSRGTKRDLVSIKNLISLLIAYQGAVVADSNVYHVSKDPSSLEPFAIPEYKEFLLPYNEGFGYDFWMMSSRPKSKEVKHIITSFLKNWDVVEEYLTNNDEKTWNEFQSLLMMDPINECMKSRSLVDYPWMTTPHEVAMFRGMKNLPLCKMYQGSHKTKEMIGELLVYSYLGSFTEYKSLAWSNCKEAVKQSVIMEKPEAGLFFLDKMRESKQHPVETKILKMIVTDSSLDDFSKYMISIKNDLEGSPTLQSFVDEMFDFTGMQDFIEQASILNGYVSQEKRDEINEREDDVGQVDKNISDQGIPEEIEENFEKDSDQEDKNNLDEATTEEMVYLTQIVDSTEDHIRDVISNEEYKLNPKDQALILSIMNQSSSKKELLETVAANLELALPSQNVIKIKLLLDPLLSAYSYVASNLFRGEHDISERDDLLETLNKLAESSKPSDSKLFQKEPPKALQFLLDLRKEERIFPKTPGELSSLKKDAG